MADGQSAQVPGIVLAGGMSPPLGRNKALEPVAGEPLVRRVMGRLSGVSRETAAVVADMEGTVVLLPRWTEPFGKSRTER